MRRDAVITVPQLFGMLFISRMVVNITYNPYMSSNGDLTDHLLSAVISYFLTFLLLIPVYLLYRKRKDMTLADYSYFLFGNYAVGIILLYVAYYLLVSCSTLSLFNTFVSNVMDPKIPIWGLSIAVMVTACYGAWKGIEALARASGIILILICISLLFLICALIPEVETTNFTPLLYDGPQNMLTGVCFMISRTSCISVMAMLLPFVKGSVKKGILAWNTSTYLMIFLILFTIIGSLGQFLKTQVFPIYAAASIAEIGMFKRLDALFLGIWTTGLFAKMALFLYLVSLCIHRIWGAVAARWSILISGAIVVIGSVMLTESRGVAQIVYDWRVLLPITLLVILVIPVVLLITDHIKNRKKRGESLA